MIWAFLAGMFFGVVAGATIMACCNMAGNADRLSQEQWDRIDRSGRVDR